MKQTAPYRNAFSPFATAPCRGFSLCSFAFKLARRSVRAVLLLCTFIYFNLASANLFGVRLLIVGIANTSPVAKTVTVTGVVAMLAGALYKCGEAVRLSKASKLEKAGEDIAETSEALNAARAGRIVGGIGKDHRFGVSFTDAAKIGALDTAALQNMKLTNLDPSVTKALADTHFVVLDDEGKIIPERSASSEWGVMRDDARDLVTRVVNTLPGDAHDVEAAIKTAAVTETSKNPELYTFNVATGKVTLKKKVLRGEYSAEFNLYGAVAKTLAGGGAGIIVMKKAQGSPQASPSKLDEEIVDMEKRWVKMNAVEYIMRFNYENGIKEGQVNIVKIENEGQIYSADSNNYSVYWLVEFESHRESGVTRGIAHFYLEKNGWRMSVESPEPRSPEPTNAPN